MPPGSTRLARSEDWSVLTGLELSIFNLVNREQPITFGSVSYMDKSTLPVSNLSFLPNPFVSWKACQSYLLVNRLSTSIERVTISRFSIALDVGATPHTSRSEPTIFDRQGPALYPKPLKP